LFTDGEKGIVDLASIAARRAVFGENSLPGAPRASFWPLFLETFQDTTLKILIVAAMVSLASGMYDDPTVGYVEGLAILVAVVRPNSLRWSFSSEE
jgi:magnesium-transporting ATPase (P-type)